MADFILGRLKFKWKGDWVTGTSYIVDDIVKFGANTYTCVVNHTADADFYVDLNATTNRWQLHTESFAYKGKWTDNGSSYAYKLNDVVSWGANLYICSTQHTSTASWDASKWATFLAGLEWESSWSSATQYQIGDVVTYGGYSYIAKADNVNKKPSQNATEWSVLTTGFNMEGVFNYGSNYEVGDVVTYGGYSYVVKTDHTSQYPQIDDGSGTVTNSSYFELLSKGFEYKTGGWISGTSYKLGDIVRYAQGSFVCVRNHQDSGVQRQPGQSSGAGYWETLAQGDTGNVMTSSGDLLTQTSGSAARLPIGPGGWQLQAIGRNTASDFKGQEITWASDWSSNTFYVDATKGEDADYKLYSPGPAQSTNINFYNTDANGAAVSGGQEYRPGDIVKFAPNAFNAANGPYQIGDIVFYEDVSLDPGYRRQWYKCIATTSATSELPTDTVKWKPAYPSRAFVQTGLTNFGSGTTIDDVAYGKSELYGEDATGKTLYKVYICKGGPVAGVKNVAPLKTNSVGSSTEYTDQVNQYWEELGSGIEVDATTNEVTAIIGWGRSQSAPFKTIRYACSKAVSGDQIICAPGTYKEFFPIKVPAGVSIMGYEMRTTFVEPNMDDDGGNGVGKCIPYTGNAGNHYTSGTPNNEVAMFLMNDSTTFRGFTLRGMVGTVWGTQVSGHTEPTVKGVCFRLDPEGQINLKSPFIQNCCAINDTGGGIYCNGSDGGGRYKSFTCNDFTQINSDGFALFATNKGRIEAVSVFTYYCHVGYTTTHGGIIRSANGNNSYGHYGAVSEGYDANEVVITGTVDNRMQEAQIYRVKVNTVGANAGQIGWAEWSYAGESYSGTPTASVVAVNDVDAANGAVSLTIRNGGITNVAMASGSTATNLTRESGNAQGGRATGTTANNSSSMAEITLKSTDSAANDAYNGMRVTITGGTGFGQTGIIHDYISATKIAEVKTETGTGGWTSLTGASIVAPDLTTTYEIEPALTVTNSGAGAGTGAKLRCIVSVDNTIQQITILDPGQGYGTGNDAPQITITDPRASFTGGPAFTIKVANGVLHNSVSNAGTGYPTGMVGALHQGVSSDGVTSISIADDSGTPTGYAEIPQFGQYLWVEGLTAEPKAGSIVQITVNVAGTPTEKYYIIVKVLEYGTYGTGKARLQLGAPSIGEASAVAHGTSFNIRSEYSSCRMTGHDFLDIGTGNFVTSNYPNEPTGTWSASGTTYTAKADQTKEVLELCGGRVFYTSTDQDGNFRVGTLFQVEQATGSATLNSEQFSISGLDQLNFGSLQFGGYGAIITEFSRDGTLSGNSDNALVTEKAIREYVTAQLGGGENDLQVNSAVVGTVTMSSNTLTTTTGSNNDLVLNSDSGKASFTAEPQYAGTISTDTTLINRSYYEDQYALQGATSSLLNTNENTIRYGNENANAAIVGSVLD